MATVILVTAVIFIVLVVTLLLVISAYRNEVKANKELENEKNILKHNITYLVQYSAMISQIKKEKGEIINEIIKENDADKINDIILSLVESNNSRL